jgi:hypothetical protein
MSSNPYFSGGLTYVHSLSLSHLKKLVHCETTRLTLSNKYIGTSLLLLDKLNSSDINKWSFSSNYYYPGLKLHTTFTIPKYYITKKIHHNKFLKCDNELILKGLSCQSMKDIKDLVSFEDDIGILFTFTANIDVCTLPPNLSSEYYNSLFNIPLQ